ncbi:MAG: hypothetical protein OXG54_13440 [Gammaproteobacteria bacterium]|nr:hypothetical protein [Gammaproteobacteria bacterium]
MNSNSTTPAGALLVGSVPLKNSEEVFTLSSQILGNHLRRIPDGETGDRANWIMFQYELLSGNPQFELVSAPAKDDVYEEEFEWARLRADVSIADLELDSLGYAEAANASFERFCSLKDKGVIPPACRFQISLPTPLAVLMSFVHREHRHLVEPAYQRRLVAELETIIDTFPPAELAIQWDIALEMALWEGMVECYFSPMKKGITDRLSELINLVPGDVEVGMHLCYGSYKDKHFKEPEDTANMVELTNGVMAGLNRELTWLHMPVPVERDDASYFEALSGLNKSSIGEIYLGLIHDSDGVSGTNRRIKAASRYLPEFGVAAECGMGRCDPERIPGLLQIHADVADKVGPLERYLI